MIILLLMIEKYFLPAPQSTVLHLPKDVRIPHGDPLHQIYRSSATQHVSVMLTAMQRQNTILHAHLSVVY